MFTPKKPPLNLDKLRNPEKGETKKRAGTPSQSNKVKHMQNDLNNLREKVYQARLALSGHSTPVTSPRSTEPLTQFPEIKLTYPSSRETSSQNTSESIHTENFVLKRKVKELEDSLMLATQDIEQQKIEYCHQVLKSEIQKRIEIEKIFAKEADGIQIKVNILEERENLRKIAEDIIEEFIVGNKGFEPMKLERKTVIGQAFGPQLRALIDFYESRIQKTLKELQVTAFYLEKIILNILSGEELKALSKLEKEGYIEEKLKKKLEFVEAHIKAKAEVNKLLESAAHSVETGKNIEKNTKNTIKLGYGEKFINLIDIFERKLQEGIKSNIKEHSAIEALIELVLPVEDRTRVIRFVKEGDLESAACVFRNERTGKGFNQQKKSPAESRKSLTPHGRSSTPLITHRSRSPKSTYEILINSTKPQYVNENYLVFLQCQASALEDFLINA